MIEGLEPFYHCDCKWPVEAKSVSMEPTQVQKSSNNHSGGFNLMMANEEHRTNDQPQCKPASTKRNHQKTHRHHKQYHSWSLSWIIFMVSMSSVQPQMIYRVDPLGKYLLFLSFLLLFFILFMWCLYYSSVVAYMMYM